MKGLSVINSGRLGYDKMKKLQKGLLPALLTAFYPDLSVNYDATCALAVKLADSGDISGLYIDGSSGEMSHLSAEERATLIREVTGAVGGRVNVIAQIGGVVSDAVPLAKVAEKAGADAISSMPPIYFKYSFDEIYAYYKKLAACVDIPLIVYNIPVYTGISFTPAQLCALMELPGVAGVKFTASDYYTFERTRLYFPDKLMYSGYDEMLLSSLAMGADGAIGTTYNFMADKFASLVRRFEKNDLAGALEMQHKVNTVIAALLEVGAIAGSKAIVTSEGIDMGKCREPFAPISDEAAAKVVAVYKKFREE